MRMNLRRSIGVGLSLWLLICIASLPAINTFLPFISKNHEKPLAPPEVATSDGDPAFTPDLKPTMIPAKLLDDREPLDIRGSSAALESKAPKELYWLSKNDFEKIFNELSFLFYRALRQSQALLLDRMPHTAIWHGAVIPNDSLPETLAQETQQIQDHYHQLLSEKWRWDFYRHLNYKHLLEGRLEPIKAQTQNVIFKNEDNRAYFEELEKALNLHTRLIRDVRRFHDEIVYQKQRTADRQPYALFEEKLKLPPFAREAALTDAIQQAMSALSVGLYQHEASDAIIQLCDIYMQPIQQLYDRRHNAAASDRPFGYNYNIYIVYGQKVLGYSGTLQQQSMVVIEPTALGDLDYIYRRLNQSLFDLHAAAQDETIATSHLNLEELERQIYAN